MLPTITRPTRVTEHSATFIDNILINSINFKKANYFVCVDISDNFPVFLCIDIVDKNRNCSSSEKRRFFNIPSDIFISVPRSYSEAGGVVIYIQDGLDYNIRRDFTVSPEI